MAKNSKKDNVSINSKSLAGSRPNPLVRTLSVDSILSLFKRKSNKRSLDDTIETPNESANEDEDDESAEDYVLAGEDTNGASNGNEESTRKRRKVKTKAEEEFEANEKKLDEELPEDLRKFRPNGYKFNIPPKDRPIRIYADGVFDLFHLGHMKQLEQAKKAFPSVELVCGVPSDVETHKRKGLTVLTDQQRIETLKHCRWVDEVIPNAPWCVTTAFLLEHKIDYVAHDDLPYASTDSDDIYKPIKEMGMFLTTQRTEGISTSDIITKIIRDYDKYLMRNFARGATRKELNVSWLKKNELEFKKHINDFRTYWKKNQTNINNVSRDLYFEVREYMRGKKFDMASFLEQASFNSDVEDNASTLNSRTSSPLTDFAAKYIGNANKDLNRPERKSLFSNVKEWMKREDSHDEYSTNDEGDSTNTTLVSSTISKKPSPNVVTRSSTASSATSSPKKVKKIGNKRTKKAA